MDMSLLLSLIAAAVFAADSGSAVRASADGLPDWVIRDATSAFEIPAEPKRADPAHESAETEPAAGEPEPPPPVPPRPAEPVLRRPAKAPRESKVYREPRTPRVVGVSVDLGDRAAFERTLETKIDAALEAMLGPDAARSFVRASAEEISEDVALSEFDDAPEAPALWDEIQARVDRIPPVLPGYPLPRSLKEEALARVAHAARPRRREAHRRDLLTVTLFIDESVEEKTLVRVTEALAGALGLDDRRPDALQVKRARLRPAWGSLVRGARFRGTLLTALCVALGGSLPLLIAWLFWKPRPQEAVKKPAPRTAGPASIRIPLWNDARYARAVADFLTREPPEAAAAVLAMMSYDAAGDVFRMLPEDRRRRVAAVLSERTDSDADEPFETDETRERLRRHLENYARGPILLSELLLRAPQSVRDTLLFDMRRANPGTARELRRAAPSLMDLAMADESSLRLCLSVFSVSDLACALYDFDPLARETMLDALPLLVREDVRRELDSFVPDSTESVDAARARITTRWRRLESDGRVRSLLSA